MSLTRQRQPHFLIISFSVFCFAFLLNFLWENLQTPLYECNKLLGKELIPHLLVASLGDALIILLIYWLGVLVYRRITWIFRLNKSRVALIVTLGLVIAVLIEINATRWQYRWDYTELMPTIYGVGIVPVLQLIILPFIIFWLTKRFLRQQ